MIEPMAEFYATFLFLTLIAIIIIAVIVYFCDKWAVSDACPHCFSTDYEEGDPCPNCNYPYPKD